MRRETVFVTLSVCITIVAASAIIAQGGPLDPPGGPVSSTYKTLDEIEPRIPIGTLPYTITETGSYYLTDNLSGAAGISVGAPGVTIDLMGHTIEQLGGQGGAAIEASDVATGLVVRNGRISTWSVGVAAEDAGDVALHDVILEDIEFNAVLVNDRVTMTDCTVRGTGDDAIVAGADSVLRSVIVSDALDSGIVLGNNAHVADVTVLSCADDALVVGDNSVVSGASLSNCGTRGLSAGDSCNVSGVLANLNGLSGIATGSDSKITDCVANDNGDAGINLSGGDSVVTDCTASYNGFIGIQAVGSTITNCTAIGNADVGISLFGGVATECVANENQSHGFSGTQSIIRNCTARFNSGDGVFVHGQLAIPTAFIENCSLQENGGAGIHAEGKARIVGNLIANSPTGIIIKKPRSVVDANEISNCSTGVQVTTSSTLIVRNRFTGVPFVIDLIAGNTFGPFVIVEQMGDTSLIPLADDPNANLVY